jgi:FkbM family methyltransferase
VDTKEVQTPKGRSATLLYREDTSDLATIGATWRLWGKMEDEYGLADLPDGLTGTALDIGAHIGSVALALLLDHPRLHVVAVEPLAENCNVIRENAERLNVQDRLTIHCAAISASDTADVVWGWQTTENNNYWRNNRYIGNVAVVGQVESHLIATVPGLSLSSLMPKRQRVPFMKIDCEGCEWIALADPAVKRIDRIAGEYHGAPGSDGLVGLLGDTHELTITHEGASGMFRAVRR